MALVVLPLRQLLRDGFHAGGVSGTISEANGYGVFACSCDWERNVVMLGEAVAETSGGFQVLPVVCVDRVFRAGDGAGGICGFERGV